MEVISGPDNQRRRVFFDPHMSFTANVAVINTQSKQYIDVGVQHINASVFF